MIHMFRLIDLICFDICNIRTSILTVNFGALVSSTQRQHCSNDFIQYRFEHLNEKNYTSIPRSFVSR